MDGARHVIGCHSTQETRVNNAFNDVASALCIMPYTLGFGSTYVFQIESKLRVAEFRKAQAGLYQAFGWFHLLCTTHLGGCFQFESIIWVVPLTVYQSSGGL